MRMSSFNKSHLPLLAALALGLTGPAAAAAYQLTPAADAYVSNEYPGTNYGDAKDLFVHAGSNTKRTYLRFDLSGLAPGKMITGASLQLSYAQGGTEGTSIALHHVGDDSWLENAITWNSRPAYDAVALDIQTIFQGHVEMTFDLPLPIFAADHDGNLSLLLKLSDEGLSDTASFYSKEAINFPGNYGPPAMLILETAPIPEPETWALMMAGLGLISWAARRRG